MAKSQHPGGRPSTFTERGAFGTAQLLAWGTSLHAITRELPRSSSTVERWLGAHDWFVGLLALATWHSAAQWKLAEYSVRRGRGEELSADEEREEDHLFDIAERLHPVLFAKTSAERAAAVAHCRDVAPLAGRIYASAAALGVSTKDDGSRSRDILAELADGAVLAPALRRVDPTYSAALDAVVARELGKRRRE